MTPDPFFSWARNRGLLLTTILLATIPVAVQLLSGHVPDPTRSDLAAYHQAFELFVHGGNPYSAAEMSALQCGAEAGCVPMMVWNPPLFFVTVGPLLGLLPPAWFCLWSAVSAVAGVGLCWLGFRLASQGRLTPEIAIAGTLSSLGLLKELEMGQFSSLLALFSVLGIWLYFARRDRLCGACLAVCVLKPHIFFVPGILFAIWIVREHRWGIVLGASLTVILGSLIAEGLHPGIHSLWIGRETWPSSVLGASLSALLRGFRAAGHQPDAPWLAVLVPLFGCAVIAVTRRWFSAPPSPKEMIIAIGVNPLFAPYGYVFEQVTLITVFGFIAGTVAAGSLKRQWYLWLLALQVGVGLALPALLHNPPLGALPLSWFSQPLAWSIFALTLVIAQRGHTAPRR